MFASLATVVLLAAAPATPTQVVKDGNAAVQKVLAQKGATVEQLATTVDGFVDFSELAKRALGKDWDKLNKKQQDDFAATMKGLLRASYAQKAIGQGKADVQYGAEKVEGNEATVPTTIAVKQDKIPVDYKLFRADPKAGWKIYDVVTDEVSLVETYRGQFRKLIADKGYDGLLTTLKNKKEQLEKQNGQAVGGSGQK
ncbi:MAG: phospholipid-binding protein MlaC [Myxococcaceae bacterium]